MSKALTGVGVTQYYGGAFSAGNPAGASVQRPSTQTGGRQNAAHASRFSQPANTPAETAQGRFDSYECETCSSRKYQDGSDDPGVSFKTAAHISPEAAAATVRGHEMEHVTRERAKAERENREIVSQRVVLHTGICPECGRPYISGGATYTSTRAGDTNEVMQNLQASAQEKQDA